MQRRLVWGLAVVLGGCQGSGGGGGAEAPTPVVQRDGGLAPPTGGREARPLPVDAGTPEDGGLLRPDAAPSDGGGGPTPDAGPAPDAAPMGPACSDEIDNDGDGLTDASDPGCEGPEDDDETDPIACGGHPVVDLNAALDADGYYEGTTVDAQTGYAGSCGGRAGGEVLLAYTVEVASAAITFTTEYAETTAPTVLYVRRACDEFEDLDCNRGNAGVPGSSVSFEPEAPGTYFLVVDTGSREGGGAFRVGLQTEALPDCRDTLDNDADGRVDLLDPGCLEPDDESEADPVDHVPQCGDGVDNDEDGLTDYPDDDDCSAAGDETEASASCDLDEVVLIPPAGGDLPMNTVGSGADYSSSCGASANSEESVAALILNAPAAVTFELVNAQHDTVLHVRTVCDDPASQVACDDDGGQGVMSRISLANAQPGTYYVFVDGFSNGNVGASTLRTTVNPL